MYALPRLRKPLLAAAVLAAAAATASAQSDPVAPAAEKFMPRAATASAGPGTLEMRRQITVGTDDITVRQLCQWTDEGAETATIADLVVDRFEPGKTAKSVTMEQLRTTLKDAGVNLGQIQFSGSGSCLVTRDEAPAVRSTPAKPTATSVEKPAAAPVVAAGTDVADAECNPFHTLKDRLIVDLSQRLNLPVDRLLISFDPKDKSLLNFSEPTFHFQVDPRRVHDLGRVSWDVTIMTGESRQKVTVNAEARAWENQVVMSKPVPASGVVRDGDVTDRRVLVEQVDQDPVLTRKQIVGQQAVRGLEPGTVVTARMIDPIPLAKAGEFVTVTLTQGSVRVRTTAKAMENGTFGQTIRVKNEQTKDVYEVTLTGPNIATMGGGGGDASLASVKDPQD